MESEARKSARDLLDFIQKSPTAFHATARTKVLFDEMGFTSLSETDSWKLEPGKAYYAQRHGSSIIGFHLGEAPVSAAGFRIAAAHSDSPSLRIKPESETAKYGMTRVAVEIYGGPITSTWLDRELGIAGLVVTERDGRITRHLYDSRRPVAIIPNLAIHMNREVNKGFEYNAQTHLQAVIHASASVESKKNILRGLLSNDLQIDDAEIRDFDLYLYDATAGSIVGVDEDMLISPRIDNLAMGHAIARALSSAKARDATLIGGIFDNEEVGSRTYQGALSGFLQGVVDRIVGATGGGSEDCYRALARSVAVSADAAHAAHPSYPDKHDESYSARLNGGPVIKTTAGYRYATTADTSAYFESLCRGKSIPVQKRIGRSDLPSGGTIGPITAAKLGVRTVDVGNPILAMHSIRETAGVLDHGYMIDAMAAHFASSVTLT